MWVGTVGLLRLDLPCEASVINWLIRLGDALSQFFNVLIFNGDSNHSVSGDAYRFNRTWLRRILDWAFSPFEEDHCRKAHIHDIDKAKKLVREHANHQNT
jgi:hypothetical protein